MNEGTRPPGLELQTLELPCGFNPGSLEEQQLVPPLASLAVEQAQVTCLHPLGAGYAYAPHGCGTCLHSKRLPFKCRDDFLLQRLQESGFCKLGHATHHGVQLSGTGLCSRTMV